jgi:23S rRNA pseudouridine2457 synthase
MDPDAPSPRRRGMKQPGMEQKNNPSGPPQRISRVAGAQRIPLILAAAGCGPLEECVRLVRAGRVARNDCLVRDPGARAFPGRDLITVDGRPIPPPQTCRYLVVHKPYQVLSCFTSQEGKATLADYVPVPDVYAAGRLDYDSEGLLLLTDDGWLLHRLTHPRYEHPKTYLVQVERIPGPEALEALRRGVWIKGERTRPAEVELLTGEKEPQVWPRSEPIRYRKSVPTAWLRVVLREGRKRQLRHMTAAVGHPTLRLIRIAIGPIALGDLPPGAWRELTEEELRQLAASLRRPFRSPQG